MTGQVKWFDPVRRYGFLVGSDKLDYFIYIEDIQSANKILYPRQTVDFTPAESPKGLIAQSIQPGPVPEKPPKSFRESIVQKEAD